MTIFSPPLRPPLRKLPAPPSNQTAAPPPVRAAAIRGRPTSRPAPPSPPPAVVTAQPAAARKRPKEPPLPALAPQEYFCRTCDRRESGATPPAGWLNVQRFVAPGSVMVFDRLQRSRRRYSQGLGFYCSPDCLLAALPRLSELCRDLRERRVGMQLLSLGEAPVVLPPPVTKGGLE